MPNHVQNILTIVGHKNHVEPMMKHLEDETSKFSFSKIIPMPEELKGTRAPALIVTEAEYKKIQYGKHFSEEPNPMFTTKGAITKKIQKDWLNRFGADNWYDWTTSHWGTKWGAYDVRIEETEELPDREGFIKVVVYFQTAWSSGAHVLFQLAHEYPTIEFYLKYADEDCGSNTGKIWWQDGMVLSSEYPDYSMENYFECWGGEEDWTCVDGEWKWNEDDE